MRVYFACGFKHVPSDETDAYRTLDLGAATEIKAITGFEVRDPIRATQPLLMKGGLQKRAKRCYELDRSMVDWADAMVAEVTYPSFWIGIELQMAVEAGKPVIVASRRSRHNADPISLMVRGSLVAEIPYDVASDLADSANKILAKYAFLSKADHLAEKAR